MAARSTNNSSQVLFDPPVEVSTIEPGLHISPPVAASADPSNAGQASLLSPELVALINQAAQLAVAAERVNQAPAVSSQTSQAQVASTSVNRGVPSSSSPPMEQYSPSSSAGPSSSGRPVFLLLCPPLFLLLLPGHVYLVTSPQYGQSSARNLSKCCCFKCCSAHEQGRSTVRCQARILSGPRKAGGADRGRQIH